jgi:aspartate/methionine/tyrosine aminotransferase
MAAEIPRPTIYFQPNTTQVFTELYKAYGLLNPPARTFFEDALYLDQSIPPSVIPLQPSNQAVFDHANKVLSEFHRSANDLELYIDPNKPKPFFYTASGSKHLIVALVYGIVTSEPHKKFVFVEQAPFYSGHPDAVSGLFNYPNARFLAFHDPSDIKLDPGETLVEFVTSPNNPDGKFRKPLTDAQTIIADFVFASSAFGRDGTGYVNQNIEWVKEARAQGKHVFSFNSASKQFGKTGTRCGYIWYPQHDEYAASIFTKFFRYISSSTVAAGTTGLAEFLNLIKALLDLPDTGKALRHDGNRSMIKRHELVEKELLKRYPGSIVMSIPSSPTFFAKIKDKRIPNKPAWEVIRDDWNVVVNNGNTMGETTEFVRMNLSGYSEGLIEFLNRLAGEKKYGIEDVLSVATHECPSFIVSATGPANTVYFAKPSDCTLMADASKGPIEIRFTPFIDYEAREVSIQKTDTSDHPVIVHIEKAQATLKQPAERIKVRWSQPFYLDGSWEIVNNKHDEEKNSE